MAQTKDYPDSLKSVVIKIEPLSLVFDHISAGIELPLGNKFLDANIGVSPIGLTNNTYGRGGVVAKAGIKLPFKFNTPFNMLYVMPEVALSNYKIDNYYSMTNGKEFSNVSAYAIMACLGFRHVNPKSRFYYDLGVDLGYGWASPGLSNAQYNFMILGDYYDENSYAKSSFSGIAISCHLSAGIMLRRVKKKFA